MDKAIFECAAQLSKLVYGRTNQFIPEKDIAALMEKFLPSPDDGKGQPEASSKCPLCGIDTPHFHPPELAEAFYTFKDLLRQIADSTSQAELAIKQARYMLWCRDNPDKLVSLFGKSAPQGWQQGAAELEALMLKWKRDSKREYEKIQKVMRDNPNDSPELQAQRIGGCMRFADWNSHADEVLAILKRH